MGKKNITHLKLALESLDPEEELEKVEIEEEFDIDESGEEEVT